MPCGDRATSDAQEKLPTGEGFVKSFRVKKHAWEMEGSLSARWLTSLVPVKRYDHVAKSDLRKPLQKKLKFSDCRKVFENKFGQVVEKYFEFVLSLFSFVKSAKFRDSSEYSDCF